MTRIYPEPVYDIDELARYNLHVHNCGMSGCAKPEMTMANILAAADEAGLEMIAITDHYNFNDYDGTYLATLDRYRAEADAIPHRVKVLYGSELSAVGIGHQLEKYETNRALDYRLYSCNHFHISPWEHPEDKSPRGYARFQYDIITALMKSGRPDCIAHPLIDGYIHCVPRHSVTAALTDTELGELCELGRDCHCALEINVGAFLGDPDFSRRLWHTGRECGVTFHLGTDAHRLVNIDTHQYTDAIKALINS